MAFRFDAHAHAYYLNGDRLPSITQMLETTGHVDTTFYTPESAARGTAIHALTADLDLGSLDIESCVSVYRGWLQAYQTAMAILQAEILAVEEKLAHPVLRFAGRPDRVIRIRGLVGVLDIKSGAPQASHALQLAMQAVLVAQDYHLPPPRLQRFGLYIQENGKFKVEEFTDRQDFTVAYDIIKRCCP